MNSLRTWPLVCVLVFTPSRRHPCRHRQACSPTCSDQAASAKLSWLGSKNKRQLLLMPRPQTQACACVYTHTHQMGPLSVRTPSAVFSSQGSLLPPCPVTSLIRVASAPLCLACTLPLRASFTFYKEHGLPWRGEVTWGNRWGRVEGGEGGPLPPLTTFCATRELRTVVGTVGWALSLLCSACHPALTMLFARLWDWGKALWEDYGMFLVQLWERTPKPQVPMP